MRPRFTVLYSLFSVLCSIACAKPAPVENPSPFDEDDPAAQPAEPPPPEPETSAADSGYAFDDAAVEPLIEQADLIGVLDRGPGVWGAKIGVEAVVDGGAFRGWKITRWDLGWKGVQTGDVVVDVNGVVLEKPEHLMALWDQLRDAGEIVIRVERDGVEELRRFTVR